MSSFAMRTGFIRLLVQLIWEDLPQGLWDVVGYDLISVYSVLDSLNVIRFRLKRSGKLTVTFAPGVIR